MVIYNAFVGCFIQKAQKVLILWSFKVIDVAVTTAISKVKYGLLYWVKCMDSLY